MFPYYLLSAEGHKDVYKQCFNNNVSLSETQKYKPPHQLIFTFITWFGSVYIGSTVMSFIIKDKWKAWKQRDTASNSLILKQTERSVW